MVKYNKEDPLFTISVASHLTSLHPRTLMLYEKAGLIMPFRTKTNRRRYSQLDIDKIKFIHYLTRQKRVNLAGVKLVLTIIEEGKKHSIDFMSSFFADFQS